MARLPHLEEGAEAARQQLLEACIPHQRVPERGWRQCAFLLCACRSTYDWAPADESHDAQLWSGPHAFYEGTMAINGIRALYFSHEAVVALVDIVVASHPDMDAGLLLPNPEKRIASSSFCAIEPRTFKSTEELQAGRQGMQLTHNVSLLAQNKLKFAQFERDGKGAVLAIDIESYELNHDKLTEIGYAFISWRKQEGGGPIKEIRSCEHLSGCMLGQPFR